ncbi:MAG: NUDIX domain-containing protein [Symbiopectobacterium sp.]
MEAGESAWQTARREAKEETGMRRVIQNHHEENTEQNHHYFHLHAIPFSHSCQ